MNTKDLLSLIKHGESETVEFKLGFNKEVIVSSVAFANTTGGIVLVGVSSDKKVAGVKISDETVQKWINEIKLATSPALIPDINIVSLKDNKKVVVIRVDEFPVKPVNTKGKYYKRVKNSNHLLDANEIANEYLKTFNLSWDAYVAPYNSLSDLDIEKISLFIKEVNTSGRFILPADPFNALEKLGMVKDKNPTHSSLLLFAREPLPYRIHIGRFKDDVTIIDDKQVQDTLFNAVDRTMAIIKSHLRIEFRITGKVKRDEIWQYPLPAIREAVINAIVHRDYTSPSDIIIKIYDNKLLIFSPGKLHRHKVEDFEKDNYTSQLRNKLVAEAFYLTDRIEKYGSGFRRIREALAGYDNVTMNLTEQTSAFLVIFEISKVGEKVPEKVPEKLSINQIKILDLIKDNNQITIPILASMIAISERKTRENLAKLKQKGIINRIGSDRAGHWEIIE